MFTEELITGAAYVQSLPQPMRQRIAATMDDDPSQAAAEKNTRWWAAFLLLDTRFMGKPHQFDLAMIKTMNEINAFGDPDAALGVILMRDDWGFREAGLDVAAQGHFGKVPGDLSDAEVLWLIAARSDIDFVFEKVDRAIKLEQVAAQRVAAGLVTPSDRKALAAEATRLKSLR